MQYFEAVGNSTLSRKRQVTFRFRAIYWQLECNFSVHEDKLTVIPSGYL